MALKEVYIENFKGIKDPIQIKLKPINVFIGPNSGGKSSILHALALLKQTKLIPTEKRALILDDEQALVHLGRYIDVVYGHNYKSQIGIGVKFDYELPRTQRKKTIRVKWKFRGMKRTQDIFVASNEVAYGDIVFNVKETSRNKYQGSVNGSAEKTKVYPTQNFIFTPDYLASEKWLQLYRSQRLLLEEINKIHYLGPFRDPPKRRYLTMGSLPSDVGASGKSTVPLLVNEMIQKKKRPNLEQVRKWLADLNLSKILGVDREGSSDIFKIEVQTHTDAPITTLADVGYGVSQVLPILVQCAFLEKGSTLLFEQPELHLHPVIQSKLPNVFIETARKKESTLLIETHSDEMVYCFLESIREGKLKQSEFNLISVRYERGCSRISIHEPDKYGEVYTNWQQGFCL